MLDEDGSIDIGVAYFVEWMIRIFAAAMILEVIANNNNNNNNNNNKYMDGITKSFIIFLITSLLYILGFTCYHLMLLHQTKANRYHLMLLHLFLPQLAL